MSRQSEISLQCYLRKEEPKRGNDGLADDMGNDIFLGGLRLNPDFDDLPTQDGWYSLSGGAGKIQIGLAFKPLSVRLLLRPTPPSVILCTYPSLAYGLGSFIDDRRLRADHRHRKG